MPVVTLKRFTPLERADSVAWTRAEIQESATATGSGTVIDTITLSPVDTDPANPQDRDLTTTLATLAEGFYRVVWIDGTGHRSDPTPWIQNTSDLAGGTRPSVQDVAGLLRARTKIRGGGEAGTFNTQTRPTADEVEGLIDDALDEVGGKVQPVDGTLPYGDGWNAPGSAYERRYRGAVRLYAAILIETSYFPEQVKSGQSAASTYQTLYESRIKALIAEGETGSPQGEGSGGPGGGDSPADAAWSFPQDAGGLVGWRTAW